ncbi:MAG: ThuA domain-containing protein [Oscillospiraceae bacterium]|nr:ThuA domain-containing protein [Oscillospiraceae bacterium]
MKKALIFKGGWDGHEPDKVSVRFGGLLEKNGYEVVISDTLDCLADLNELWQYDLFVSCWTMGQIKWEYVTNLSKALAAGAGMAGCHGGMCDSFRENTEWQFITGGQWISHPGGGNVKYTVNVCKGSSPIVEGLEDFEVTSEHYYLHVDPAIEVLATTRFPVVTYYNISNKPIDMPVAWTKYWGNGRIFYTSLGHIDSVFDLSPTAQVMMERGMVWAGAGKQYAIENGLTTARFENNAKMY